MITLKEKKKKDRNVTLILSQFFSIRSWFRDANEKIKLSNEEFDKIMEEAEKTLQEIRIQNNERVKR